MGRIIEKLIVVITITLIIFATGEKISAQYTQGNECSKEMAQETATYIQNSNIPFRGSRSEFYSNNEERIYVLYSDENINPTVVRPISRIAAVINYKAGNERDGFYLVESRFRRDFINYYLTKNSETIDTVPVKMGFSLSRSGPGAPGDAYCDWVNANNRAIINQLQEEADRLCLTLYTCLPICLNGQVIGAALRVIKPRNIACARPIALIGPLLGRAFNTVVDTDVSMFTTTSTNN